MRPPSELTILTLLCLVVVLKSQALSCSQGKCQLRETCSSTPDCARGLYCSSCAADSESTTRCHRYQTTNATSIRGGLAFNKYSWLTTHNAFSIVGEPSQTGTERLTFYNQEDNVTDQLNEPAINTLREMESFLSTNPSEIITIFIEDYVRSSNGLTKLFNLANLTKYWFPVSSMPQKGEEWPTVTEMVAKNYRLLVFTSNRTKEATEGIAYNWKYVNENQYGDEGLIEGNCTNRAESAALNDTSRSLVLMNFFPTNPVQDQACTYNSAPLLQMVPVCYAAAGARWPNFLAVDFYKRSDGGGAFTALDTMSAGHICGCSDIAVCKLNLTYGVCPSTNTSTSEPANAPIQPPSTISVDGNKGLVDNSNSHAHGCHNNLKPMVIWTLPLITFLHLLSPFEKYSHMWLSYFLNSLNWLIVSISVLGLFNGIF